MKTSEILKSKENALHSVLNEAMFTLYRIAFAPVRKLSRIRILFTHKNGNIFRLDHL